MKRIDVKSLEAPGADGYVVHAVGRPRMTAVSYVYLAYHKPFQSLRNVRHAADLVTSQGNSLCSC